jgi:DNA helicase II / ATP-dependent DNA helicase PcrA
MEKGNELTACRIVGGVGCGKTQMLIERVVAAAEAASAAASSGAQGSTPAGAAANSILALCASPQAALAFGQRLAAANPAAAAAATVTTPRALALSVLSDAEAIRWSGRDPRILTAYEELFLLEDMKVSGLRPKRLREMLKFFYRSWTELADDENWLLAGEETNIHDLLKANLSFMRVIAEPEAANLAVNYLRSHEGARVAHGFDHVFFDDYQLASRASQQLAGLVARESITIAGDRAACVQVYDSYPYAAGIEEFASEHPGAENVELHECHNCGASAAAANALQDELAECAEKAAANAAAIAAASAAAADGSAGAANGAADADATPEKAPAPAPILASANSDAGETVVLNFDRPEDEFIGLGEYVSGLVGEGISADEIVIATPNGTWGRNLGKASASAGVPTAVLPDRQPVRGDIRDNAKCVPAHVLTALDLVADPNNALAWRCWCGYNDWLANSSAMSNLRDFADERKLGLVDALSEVAGAQQAAGAALTGASAAAGSNATASKTDQVVGGRRVADAYAAGLALIEATAGLEGEALLAKLTSLVTGDENAQIPPIVRELCLCEGNVAKAHSDCADSSCDGQTSRSPLRLDAASMATRFRERLLAPSVPAAGCVKVVPYDQCAGLSPKVLIVAGFVNGFIPCQAYFDGAQMALDKQEKEHERDTRRVYSMAGKAEKRLVVSRFANTDLETAAALKLSIGRIRLVDGVRTCKIPPSDFTEFLA